MKRIAALLLATALLSACGVGKGPPAKDPAPASPQPEKEAQEAVAALPEGFPAGWMPLYPGTRLLSAKPPDDILTAWTADGVVEGATLEEVLAFYREAYQPVAREMEETGSAAEGQVRLAVLTSKYAIVLKADGAGDHVQYTLAALPREGAQAGAPPSLPLQGDWPPPSSRPDQPAGTERARITPPEPGAPTEVEGLAPQFPVDRFPIMPGTRVTRTVWLGNAWQVWGEAEGKTREEVYAYYKEFLLQATTDAAIPDVAAAGDKGIILSGYTPDGLRLQVLVGPPTIQPLLFALTVQEAPPGRP